MGNRIHSTAIIDARAELGEDVEVGPGCVIGGGVRLGAGCRLESHVVVAGPTTIGAGNVFYPFACIGQQSQDLKYAGEPTYLEIGDRNTFREFVTVHRATAPGGVTKVGSGGNFLSYSHIAHDCIVGDEVIFSNNGTLAGHVEVGDRAVVGGLTAVHQFCRIGRMAITGGCSKIVQDVPPYMLVDGNPARVRHINHVGLERAGMPKETIRALLHAYKILYRLDLNTAQALEKLRSELGTLPEIDHLIDFVSKSERGITR